MAREAELELQQKVHRHRLDEGVRALRELVLMRIESVNNRWMDSSGDELLQYQGESRALRKMVRMIDDEPTIKGE
jgi:hypothetical protein